MPNGGEGRHTPAPVRQVGVSKALERMMAEGLARREWWCESEGATRRGGCVRFLGEEVGKGPHAKCGWAWVVPMPP